jgi:hypothetical protein
MGFMISYDLNGSKEESKWVTNPKDITEENDGHGYELSLSIYYQFFLKKIPSGPKKVPVCQRQKHRGYTSKTEKG